MSSCRRPEHQAPPEFYYNADEARKYTSNSHVIDVQMQLSERALELLNLPEDETCYILDIGCGSGLSGETVTEAGHHWVGVDISSNMLDVALEREVEGDLILSDMGNGMPFRPGTFDGAISISALQWLCYSDKKYNVPVKRLYRFFTMLYTCLSRGSKAVFQVYPETSSQIDVITQQSMRAGFTGGLVVDYPNSSKAKKMFLCLFTSGCPVLPTALGADTVSQQRRGENTSVAFMTRREKSSKAGSHRGTLVKKGSKEWILRQKEKRKKKQLEVRLDSKYTGRKRKDRW